MRRFARDEAWSEPGNPQGWGGGGLNLKDNRQKWLIASLLYGCGIRLSEALRLRANDVEFGQGILAIRHAKGG